MAEFFFLECINISNEPLSKAKAEVSFDGGQTFRDFTAAELSGGLLVQVSQKFTIRVSVIHYQPIVQPLLVKPVTSSQRTSLEFDGAPDFAAGAVTSVEKNSGFDQRNDHSLTVIVSLFRDGTPARAQAGQAQLPNFPLASLVWTGQAVLNNGGSGFGRFAAQISPPQPPIGASTGKLVFGLTADDSVPQLAGIFVPNSVDLNGPIPMHVFFAPSTGAKKRPYPFSDGPGSFNEVLDNYLVNVGKRLLSQHVAAKVHCVFVFPLPPPSGYLKGLQDAGRLRQYCLEAAFFVKRFVGGQRVPLPVLGRCALSGFSEGGRPLHSVVTTANGAFPELKEVYGLDIVPPSGSSSDVGSYQQVLGTLSTWHDANPDHHVRLYTHYPAFSQAGTASIKPPTVRQNSGATESQGRNATFAFLPIAPFWTTIDQEVGPTPNPNYVLRQGSRTIDDGLTHQLIPSIMLEHALANSGFQKG